MHVLDRPAPPPGARLRYGGHPSEFGDLRLPDGPGPHPVVINLHGGYWRSTYGLETQAHMAHALSLHGFATWNLEYRRLGEGGGYPGTFESVARGTDFLVDLAASGAHPLDARRIVTLGFSAGGHLSLWLAARHRLSGASALHHLRWAPGRPLLRGAVGLAAPADLERASAMGVSDRVVDAFMGGTPAEVPDRYAAASPAALLPLGIPQRLFHGTRDDSVPYALSVGYHARAVERGDPVELDLCEGAGHFELLDPDSAVFPAILTSVRRLAAAGQASTG